MDIKEEMKLRQWAQDMADQKASGLSQKQFAAMKGIGTTTFRYRCKKVVEAMEEKLAENDNSIIPSNKPMESVSTQEPCFAKVNLSPEQHTTSGINIKFQDTLINIAPDAPADHVKMVLEVLAHAQ